MKQKKRIALAVMAGILCIAGAATALAATKTRLETVQDTYWDDDTITIARWEEVEEAYQYEIYLYRDESKVADAKTKKEYINLKNYMKTEGDYTFKVRALAKSSSSYKDGYWSDLSDTSYVSETYAEYLANGGKIDTENSGPGAKSAAAASENTASTEAVTPTQEAASVDPAAAQTGTTAETDAAAAQTGAAAETDAAAAQTGEAAETDAAAAQTGTTAETDTATAQTGAAAETDAATAQTGAAAGWQENETGRWYRNTDGTWPANTWWQDPDTQSWYCFDEAGYARTGWIEAGDTTYYCDGTGAMVTGSYLVDGVTYLFDPSGALQGVRETETTASEQETEAAETTAAVEQDPEFDPVIGFSSD